MAVKAFIICAFLPWLWQIGSVWISPYRLVLILAAVPCIFMWLSGRAGTIRAADISICFYCLWCFISLSVVHGVDAALQPAGTMTIETAGAYFLGRCFIRTPEQFHAMSRLLFWIIVMIFPLAIIESVSNTNISLDVFSTLFPTHVVAENIPRWGLRRVQSVFEHPILFGVTCGAILALVHLVVCERASPVQRWGATGVVLVTAALSLSSGPITALMVQILILFWDRVFKAYPKRWRVLWILLLAMYGMISLVSNQSVPEFLMTHFTFDAASANYRTLIWHFGSGSALNHPLFGVGFNRWDRPEWMPNSIDMFWLYHAVLFGIPAGLLMILAFLMMVIPVAFKRGLEPRLVQYRTAYLAVMSGYFLVGWTVHFWNATYVLFLFFLGSGSWLLDTGNQHRKTSRDGPGAIPNRRPSGRLSSRPYATESGGLL
ncbi:O-antigen polymerase (plasmid) [Rhizobium grahamii CCGE 502]|uniref:O-antigen polymerase n=2 Tax=Rhizobium grahamii TaxID=1120045 RepID=S3I664_9HYPH|nr:O-antigen polymerase [Rhizobium grahamii CCGE 502]